MHHSRSPSPQLLGDDDITTEAFFQPEDAFQPERVFHSEDGFQPEDPSSDNDPFIDSNLFSPLYPNANITICGALCSIMQFCIANNLTYTAIDELLKLLVIICPDSNFIPKSFYLFKKFFQQFTPIYDYEKICPKCICNVINCTCEGSKLLAHLVHLDISKQLERILQGIYSIYILYFILYNVFLENWQHLLPINASRNGTLQDVWDGSGLHPLIAPDRFFSNPHNMALSLSTDGVPLYKSSAVSLWPVYVVVLNLSPHIRMNSTNIILCGVWVGPSKPIMSLLLNPVAKYLETLSSVGMQINTPDGIVTVRAKLILGIFDLPAKALVLCAKQYNGEFGCSVCLHPGKRLQNNARIYLPDRAYPDRTHTQVIAAACEAEASNSIIQGIISMSPFASTLDLVASIPVDYMHAVLEGVCRWLMKAWFESKFHLEPFYIGRQVKAIDIQLTKQKPPTEFSHPPRSIEKHLHYWKASEIRSWLLFYSLPLLLGYLPSLYWHHYELLVCAMHILLGTSITLAQLEAAEQMLKDFCILLPELYSESSCTANAHLLTHLPKYVRLWGPLWTHSAFGFESKSGSLKHLFHGKSDIVHQLLFNIDVMYTLEQVRTKLVEFDSQQTVSYIEQLSHLPPRSNMTSIGTHTYIVGKCKLIKVTTEMSAAIGHGAFDHEVKVFGRMFKDGVMYYSNSYTSINSKRDNTYCCYQESSDNGETRRHFGHIKLFLLSPSPHALLAPVTPMQPTLINKAGHPCRESLVPYQEVDLLNSYIVPVALPTSQSQLTLIPVHCIVSKVVLVFVHGNHYIIIQPNTIERH